MKNVRALCIGGWNGISKSVRGSSGVFVEAAAICDVSRSGGAGEGKKDKKLRLTFVRLILLIFLLHWCWWSLFIRIMGESTFKCSGPGKMSAFYGVPRKMSCAVPSWWMDVSEYIAAPFFVLKYFPFTLSPHSLGTFSHFILLEQCRKSSTRSGVLGSSTLFHDQTLSPFHKQGSGGWIFWYFWCVFVVLWHDRYSLRWNERLKQTPGNIAFHGNKLAQQHRKYLLAKTKSAKCGWS